MRRRGGARWKYPAVALATGIALGAGAVVAVHSPLFETGGIAVTGANRYSQEKVLKLAGLSQRTNAFFLDTDEIENRLERDPWIADASVERSLPKTVSIDIVERVPVAAMEGGGQFRTLASDGTVLADSPRAPDLPLVVVAGVRDLAGACSLAGAMQPSLRAKVDLINVDGAGDVLVNLDSGLAVAYGGLADGEAKAQALSALLRWGQDQHIDFVSADVSVPSAPSAEIAGGVTVTPSA